MELKNSVILITGANRGVGLALAKEALERGAAKVYAAARDPEKIALRGVVPVRLDVTNQDDVDRAVATCPDVTLLVNNAGISRHGGVLSGTSEEAAREQMETNFFGPFRLSKAFAPVLAANGGGAILNVLSVLSWRASAALPGYCASKAAAWALTNTLRHELRAARTQVIGMHMGYIDTDMTRDLDLPKTSPVVSAKAAFDGIETGLEEILVDEVSRLVQAGLSSKPSSYMLPPGQ